MKKNYKNFLVGFGCLALLACSSESEELVDSNVSPEKPTNEVPVEEIAELNLNGPQLRAVKSANDLTFDIFDQSSLEASANENICISPVSILNFMSLMANGASSETLSYLTDILGLEGSAQDVLETLNSLCKEYCEKLPKVDPSASFEMTNSLWLGLGLTAQNSFEQSLNTNFGGVVVPENPAGLEGMQKVNAWVDRYTQGLIPKFLEEPLSEPILLLNTVYFKGGWSVPFDKTLTTKDSFHNGDASLSTADYMRDTRDIRYSENDKHSMVSLPFGNGTYSMSFVLPKDEASNAAFSIQDWNDLSERYGYRLIDLYIPKFNYSYGVEVSHLIGKIHPESLSKVQFSRVINGGEDVALTSILHKTKILIDEEKCEGAAVTGGTLGMGDESPQPRLLKFDRPFYFVVHEQTTGAILFLGRISSF